MALLVRTLSALAASTVTVFVIVRAIAADSYPVPPRNHRPHISSVPGFQLFPPNAAISLTEDNSTFFPARPATFGPELPEDGLSAALWIGAGFGEDGVEPQGELGCSDVPGWDGKRAADGNPVLPADGFFDDGTDNYLEDYSSGTYFRNLHKTVHAKAGVTTPGREGSRKAADGITAVGADVDVDEVETSAAAAVNAAGVRGDSAPTASDFTAGAEAYGPRGARKDVSWKDSGRHDKAASKVPHHSDIQSLQEGAEIAGKIVLLRRGGCGFLAKVMWAQRRGAVGVIVGDDRKGGPLIQMYASGDTSFVTIPSVFTAHTTAHLLTALVEAVQDDETGLKKAPGIETKTKTKTTTTAPAPEKTDAADDSWFWKTRPREWVLDEYIPTSTSTATGADPTSTGSPGKGKGKVLFVTIAPTRSTLPLLDTLLVVIASPLLAIIVITGILIFIRTHYRYRAWRAPKAVVEQLPVHIYVPPGAAPPAPIAVPLGSAVASPLSSPARSPSPPTLEPTLTTPLLQRPRSRTTTGVPGDERRVTVTLPPAEPHPPSRYFQVECVVCLEDYVAGDRVMSLPCGHEFHESCITPWLTTRRRTCPICKGDVVRATAGESA
ncbi:hypothetical protein HMPREF1624_05080 [Sporothrix schenckii ATCC 58251]|uniref:RING-type domain-containing protein n=1 Tax=Sporothrix schenckii (strain ATCC 58251 / de Perez 2211183) TaxID=1391915 RepID=U7PTL1_SPOS1|nr:hypothetical protein HMPREF1624_05080 [Sporothrix schenckii ATCC 58251]